MDPRLTARYGSTAGAAAYRRKYEKSWTRRLSHRREMRVVAAAVRDAGAGGRFLDCPCGAGRLVPTLLEHAEHVTAVDLSPAMVEEARDALAADADAGRVAFAVAPADALPFPDRAFDVAVCHRLLHHLADPAARTAILRELARVARRAVVCSFSDATTLKGRVQSWRGQTGRRIAFAPATLRAEAQAAGLLPLGPVRRLNGLSSLVAVTSFRAPGA
jgi:ubiquinone/menaquinone biosynthesis C-methylase UbiE